ncbi:hypothetical protein CCACVL1_14270 [Corchorus capsularis]|uniref:Uncharacterized protein n=1 Tax=Corchorus capsularis TaxID=210143 RepID=A0A1R3I7N8_COCAP|nr:hypothetical protein CCACVL1_14270 [Corchorus capsularis]
MEEEKRRVGHKENNVRSGSQMMVFRRLLRISIKSLFEKFRYMGRGGIKHRTFSFLQFDSDDSKQNVDDGPMSPNFDIYYYTTY